MRESRTYGSVRGAPSNGRPYRDPAFADHDDGGDRWVTRKDGWYNGTLMRFWRRSQAAPIPSGSKAAEGQSFTDGRAQ
jgi:hypothetical protein